MTIRFDDAWAAGKRLARDLASSVHADVVVVRDLLGRISIVVNDQAAISRADRDQFSARLRQEAGPFSASEPVVLASEMFAPDAVLEAPDLRYISVASRTETAPRVGVLERELTGAEWLHPKMPSNNNWVALYGFKGGVGRSTATYVLAQHLAQMGKCVMVVDLDLESPGIGALLQTDESLPDHGLVDFLVEQAVGNADGLDLVARSNNVRVAGNGEVWLAPAAGRPREGYDYLAKLNRSYLDIPTDDGGRQGLGDRLHAAVHACQTRVASLSRRPDVVLLDSRAGIHDIAAVALTQLADVSLLFASDSGPTWAGYSALFSNWGRSPDLARQIRERIRMVAAMVPRARRDEYLELFRDHAQACLASTLYDDIPSHAATEGNPALFNPPIDDETAPHSPLPILFSPELVGIDPTAQRDWHRIDPGAYTEFVHLAADLILGEEE